MTRLRHRAPSRRPTLAVAPAPRRPVPPVAPTPGRLAVARRAVARPAAAPAAAAVSPGLKSSGPTIAYFRVAHKPSCPAGTNINPIAGTPVLVEWKANNVDSVALSIDGPGVYADDYPAAGSEAFNFPCSGGGGDIQKHTYLLTVRNAHGTQTRTLVVSARVHDIPVV